MPGGVALRPGSASAGSDGRSLRRARCGTRCRRGHVAGGPSAPGQADASRSGGWRHGPHGAGQRRVRCRVGTLAATARRAGQSDRRQANRRRTDRRRTIGDAASAPPSRAAGRFAHDVASFTIEALPAEAFEALLIVATWLGEVLVDDPPYQLDVALAEPFDCWCRLDLVPDAGASTVALDPRGVRRPPRPRARHRPRRLGRQPQPTRPPGPRSLTIRVFEPIRVPGLGMPRAEHSDGLKHSDGNDGGGLKTGTRAGPVCGTSTAAAPMHQPARPATTPPIESRTTVPEPGWRGINSPGLAPPTSGRPVRTSGSAGTSGFAARPAGRRATPNTTGHQVNEPGPVGAEIVQRVTVSRATTAPRAVIATSLRLRALTDIRRFTQTDRSVRRNRSL